MEREEEMNRMREKFDLDVDSDKDGVISLVEFTKYTKSSKFKNNEEWKVSESI